MSLLLKMTGINIIGIMDSIVILAGGKSSRMGVDKSHINLFGKLMIDRIIERIGSKGNEIIVVSNEVIKFSTDKVKIVPDYYQNYGALAGLQAGIKEAKNDLVLVVANDMPFINLELFDYMRQRMVPGVDVVIPDNGRGLEPFHAIFRKKSCLPAIEKVIQEQSKRIISWFPLVKVVIVEESVIDSLDPEGLAFFNVNTPVDLQRAEQIIANMEKPSHDG